MSIKKTTKDEKNKNRKTNAEQVELESASKYPDMELCQKIHRIIFFKDDVDNKTTNNDIEIVLTEIIEKLENPSLYRYVVSNLGGKEKLCNIKLLSDDELSTIDKKHENTLQDLEKKVEEAKESAGDMEVMDARIEVARFASKSCSFDKTIESYDKLITLPKISSGKKIDCYMETSRNASFYNEQKKSDEMIEKALKMATEGGGGDWDRRNRLKVYRALSKLLSRDTKTAASLLIDCIATFSCNEICSYKDFIVYTILSNLLHISRTQLKTKIIDGPEILSVAKEIPTVIELVKSLYDCDYNTYFKNMVEMELILKNDRYFAPHVAYWMRELHILAYKQFLDSYQSVTLDAMAKSFGVSTKFIDYHASRFIAAGRLSAKIDKFGGVIVTNRPDLKNAQYRDMIQKGDLLLNRIQKLARVVDL